MGTSTDGREAADERLTTVGLLFESAAGLRRLFERRLEPDSIASNQSFDVLIRLARTEGNALRMSELAAQTSLSPSGLTRAVDRLQDQGLVTRRTCPQDKRGSFAELTPAGKERMESAIPEHLAHIGQLLSELFSPAEEARLSSLLRRLRDHVREQNTGAGWACDPPDDIVICPNDS